jgi:hypothetical protein
VTEPSSSPHGGQKAEVGRERGRGRRERGGMDWVKILHSKSRPVAYFLHQAHLLTAHSV